MQPAKIDTSIEVAQVVKWMLSGATSFDILEAVAKNFPGTQPMPLMLAAAKHFEKMGDFDPAIVRGWAFEATRDLYRKMVEAGDFAGALRAVKQIMEMTRNVPDRPAEEEGEEEGDTATEGFGAIRSAQEPDGPAPT